MVALKEISDTIGKGWQFNHYITYHSDDNCISYSLFECMYQEFCRIKNIPYSLSSCLSYLSTQMKEHGVMVRISDEKFQKGADEDILVGINHHPNETFMADAYIFGKDEADFCVKIIKQKLEKYYDCNRYDNPKAKPFPEGYGKGYSLAGDLYETMITQNILIGQSPKHFCVYH